MHKINPSPSSNYQQVIDSFHTQVMDTHAHPFSMAKRLRGIDSLPITSHRPIEQMSAEHQPRIKPINSVSEHSQGKKSLYKVKTRPFFSLDRILWLSVSFLGNAVFIQGAVRWRPEDLTIAKTNNSVAAPLIATPPLAIEKLLHAEEYEKMMQGDQPQLEDANDPYQAYAPSCKSTDGSTRLVKINKQIIRLLKKKSLLDNTKKPHKFIKADIIAAVARLLFEKADQHKVKLARIILKISGRYGGQINEPLSKSQVNKLVNTWLFESMLGETLEAFIARQTASSEYPDMLTVGSLIYWLSLDVVSADHASLAFRTESDRQTVDALWQGALEQEIPLLAYHEKHPEVKMLPLDGMRFSALYGGSLLLNDQGIDLKEIPLETAIQTGLGLWQMALEDGVALDMMRYYALPAMLYNALRGIDKTPADCYRSEVVTRSAALENYLGYLKVLNDENRDFSAKIASYKTAVGKWINRGQLADKYIDLCPPNSLKSLSGYEDPFLTPEQKLVDLKKSSKEAYLNIGIKPCDTAPNSIDDEYVKETNVVADAFSAMNEILIKRAFNSLTPTEQDFISAENTLIQGLVITNRKKMPERSSLHNYAKFISNRKKLLSDFTKFENAVAFSITLNNEMRCYVVKDEPNHGYDIIRIDFYIPDKNFEEVTYYDHDLKYENGSAAASIIKDTKTQGDMLHVYIKNKHRDKFYTGLYQSGYSLSDLQKIWDSAKHMIPFWDCGAGIYHKDAEEAVPACLMDAISLLSVSSRVLGLVGRFGSSVAIGLNEGATALAKGQTIRRTFTAAGINGIQHISLPTIHELRSVGVAVLRVMDPGFELMANIGKKALAKLFENLVRYNDDKLSQSLFRKLKLKILQNDHPKLIKPDFILPLPQTEMQIPFKKIGRNGNNDIVVAMNPDTGELFGNRYQLNDGVLSLASPAYQADAKFLKEIRVALSAEHELNQHSEANSIIVKQPIRLMNQPFNPLPGPSGINNIITNVSSFPKINKFLPATNFNDGIKSRLDRRDDIENAVKGFYNTNDIYMFKCGDDITKIPTNYYYLKNGANYFKQALINAENLVAAAREKFNLALKRGNGELKFGNHISSYLSKVLKTKNVAILKEAEKRLKYYIDNIHKHLTGTNHNVLLATCTHVSHTYVHNGNTPLGFTYTDDMHNSFVILVDNFGTAKILSSRVELTMLHEISHCYGTMDFMVAPSTSLVGDASEFREVFDDGILGRNNEVINIDDNFVDSYNAENPTHIINKAQMQELLKHDEMLKANAFMDNADFIARMISDLGSKTLANSENKIRLRKRMTDKDFNISTFNHEFALGYLKMMIKVLKTT